MKPMFNDDLKYWLALKLSEDTVGNVMIAGLAERFGSPKNVFDASLGELIETGGVKRGAARRIKSFDDWERIEREIASARERGIAILTPSSPAYPRALLTIYDRPAVLYVQGTLPQDAVNIAVVGSRAASTYGKYVTENLCRELALKGITVVSGMARGIDTSAHRGALAGRGSTIAVLGSGLNVVYPPENRELCHDIGLHGAVVSEFPLDTEPKPTHFPRRNRIISGLSLGVVVVEAHEKSGSLITARCALEQGRDVFAVPGPVDSAGSKGTHRLIREGAKLTATADDILEEIIPRMVQSAVAANRAASEAARQHTDDALLTPLETRLEQLIGQTPVPVDDIIGRSGIEAGEVLAGLTSLELIGRIIRHPGNTYALKNK